MSLSRDEFEVLSGLERREEGEHPLRELSDRLGISGSPLENCIDTLSRKGFLLSAGGELSLTPAGLKALEPYRVKRAVILAAGFGSRMMPATRDRPKPMVRVRGKRIIETLLDALIAAGITDITVVGGYRFEKLQELLERYPSLQLIRNEEYDRTNNISSAVLAADRLSGGCYLCEADLLVSNPQIITKYQYASNILGSYCSETDDWCYRMEDGFLTDYRKGGSNCFLYYGISFWTAEDCGKLRQDFVRAYGEPEGKDLFWEFVPFVLRKDRYRVEIRQCSKTDVTEIDSYAELARLDPAYREEKGEQ